MKTLGPNGLRWLKIVHVFLVVVFFGGILSSLAINLHVDFSRYDASYPAYKHIVLISDHVIRWGAAGTLLVGFIYGFFTKWGFFKHRWVGVKFVLYLVQTVVGIFIVDNLMMENMHLLETQQEMALHNPDFLRNHEIRQVAVFFQVAVTTFIFIISYLKPWKKKKRVTT
ncbi:DUF2269 family protein [Staphylospora marina]|uniref:DUF2269 family protein n=1 Tax=Staphylospora marina TaxID=2490858 RepID=UPI000F5BFB9A|nr:DUF2269 family protein [Staphylospora marina]